MNTKECRVLTPTCACRNFSFNIHLGIFLGLFPGICLGICLYMAFSAHALAQDMTINRMLASQCAQCHGTNGNAVGDIDKLTDESYKDLVEDLTDMRNEDRPEGIMDHQALGYSDDQIDRIARYFDSISGDDDEPLPPVPDPPSEPDPPIEPDDPDSGGSSGTFWHFSLIGLALFTVFRRMRK